MTSSTVGETHWSEKNCILKCVKKNVFKYKRLLPHCAVDGSRVPPGSLVPRIVRKKNKIMPSNIQKRKHSNRHLHLEKSVFRQHKFLSFTLVENSLELRLFKIADFTFFFFFDDSFRILLYCYYFFFSHVASLNI